MKLILFMLQLFISIDTSTSLKASLFPKIKSFNMKTINTLSPCTMLKNLLFHISFQEYCKYLNILGIMMKMEKKKDYQVYLLEKLNILPI